METFAKFRERIVPYLTPEDVCWAELGYIISKFAHRYQVRKKEIGPDGQPVRYFEHPRRAMLILMDTAKCCERISVISALLHDTLEDTKIVTPERLRVWFGPEVEEIVVLLTKDPADEKGYVQRLWEARNWRALLVKMCDRLDNLRTLGSDIAFQKKQITETKEKYFPLLNILFKIVPEEGLDGVKALHKEILNTIESYERNWP